MLRPRESQQQEHQQDSQVSKLESQQTADMPEKEAIARAQRGDASGFERIYQLHSSRVYALCLRMLGNTAEAEDLAQEAFLLVFRKIGTFRGDSAFSTWLHRLTVNLVLMRRRRKTPHETSLDEASEPDSNRRAPQGEFARPDVLLTGSLDRLHLERALAKLNPFQKLVVILHDIQGYKHTEIAKIMDWSTGNSKSQLHRARIRLRKLLRTSLDLGCITPPPTADAAASA